MKKIVYSANIGGYDHFRDPHITPGWEYILFTDKNIGSSKWKVIKVEPEKDKVRQARKIKIMPPFEYDECIWVDASIQVRGSAEDFARKAGTREMMLMKHPHRTTFNDECEACIRLKKDEEKTIRKQFYHYSQLTDLSQLSIAATGIIYRKNTHTINAFNSVWWREVETYSKRDQLSFGLAALQTHADFFLLNENIYDKTNNFFLLNKHI